MRTTYVTLAMAILGMFVLRAQDQDRDRIQDQDRTKLVALDGEMVQLRDRTQLHLREKQTLSDGTVLYPNGKYETTDGKMYRLKNGESLDGDGALYRNEYQYQHKIRSQNAGLTPEQVRQRNQNRQQYMMINGEVYRLGDLEQIRLRQSLQLGNGVTAYPDGTYQIRDRDRVQLQTGECLSGAGEVYRNMYQYRKNFMKQLRNPAMNKMKKGVMAPKVPTRRKTTT